MSKLSRLVACCVTVALWSRGAYAQSMPMGIDDLFRLADENSKSIQMFATGTEAAAEALKAAKAQRRPELNVSASASYLGNGRLWDRDFSDAMKVDMPHFGNNFSLEASQVVYAGGAIQSGIRLADLGKQMAELDAERNRQDIRFVLVGHYLELYKLDNQAQVLRKNIELTLEVITEMKARLQQGTALENDITRYELQEETLKLQLAKVTDACKIMNHKLVTTLHLPQGTEVVPLRALADELVAAGLESEWQDMATQYNLQLQQAQVNQQMSEQKIKMERSELLPHISLVAADHLDGPITIEVPALDNNFNYWYVGVGVSYSISSLFKNNRKLKQAKLNAQQSKEAVQLAEEQVENAVQESHVDFLTAFTDLRTQEKSVELAGKNYSVINNRYENGLALLTDMLDASNTKLDAELGLVNARINVIYHYYKMKYVTHTL